MAAAAAWSAGPPPAELRARYESAARFFFWNLEERVPGLLVEPVWQADGKAFRYRRGGEIRRVDLVSRRETTAGLEKETDSPHVDPAADLNVAPGGRWAVRTSSGDLLAVPLAGGSSRQLTTDGSEEQGYALPPDADLEHLKRARSGQTQVPQGWWSADGRRFLTYRVDQRDIARLPMVLSTQPGREHQLPYLYLPRIPLPGAEKVPLAKLVVFDVESGLRTDLDVPPLMMPFGSLPAGGAEWTSGDRRIDVSHWSRDFRVHTLYEADSATGAARVVVTETSRLPSRQVVNGDDAPIFTRVAATGDVIVRSVRDGWPHLYLYDGRTGKLRNRITAGNWAVHEIKWVDASRRMLYFTAGGREAGRDPYCPHLYRVGLDGKGLELLTPEDASHEIHFAPTGEYFIDTHSTVAQPPVTSVRTRGGRLVMNLAPADVSYVKAQGWIAPRRERVKAADGTTDIRATLFFPPEYDPNASYPLIEVIYAGPQAAVAPTRFLEDQHPAIPLTRLGFMVVVIDGRGSALRSQAFQDVSFGKGFGDEAIVADHVAAIRELARRHPAIDLARVGIYGHSWGGYRAARAMFQFPDFYRAGVSSAGSHDNYVSLFDSERWLGAPREDPEAYALQSNLPLAGRLSGALLLAHGEADEIVHPANTLQMADALIRAGKPFDMLLYPGKGHADLKYAGYFNRRVWDFFVRHLLGQEPPADVRVLGRGE